MTEYGVVTKHYGGSTIMSCLHHKIGIDLPKEEQYNRKNRKNYL